jgi:tetratricopeptide (TPR) repeat protein
MHGWEHDLGSVGASAPSWLTFQVHRPYFDGAVSPVTAIQARGVVLAARLFDRHEPTFPRFSMVMPASYRKLLIEESRLDQYRVSSPADLPAGLASAAWTRLAGAFERRGELDGTDRAGLALWLVAACLPSAVIELVPADLSRPACASENDALAQYARATALFQLDGLSVATAAAFAPLITDPAPTVAHLQAVAGWAALLARHAKDDGQVPRLHELARELCDKLTGTLPPFQAAVWQARLALRETTIAQRHEKLDEAWRLLCSGRAIMAAAGPDGDDEQEVALELTRRLIDRRVEIAVLRGEEAAEDEALTEGLTLDPHCVKIQMQAAQAAERRGDTERALAGYLRAARLGPFGTGFALLRATQAARELGLPELATALSERALRSAPRSAQVRQALLDSYQDGEPLAAMFSRRPTAEQRSAGAPEWNWHYLLYGSYFNLGPAGSPCLYARIPLIAYEFAAAGRPRRLSLQRILPPAFRRNLISQSGLTEFDVKHPADLPARLRTPAWERLCEWLASFPDDDPQRQLLTAKVLFRLGFGKLAVGMVPDRPVRCLDTPGEFYLYHWREIARYATSVGGDLVLPVGIFAMVDHPGCPLHLKLAISTHGVVLAARTTKSLADAERWRERATGFLAEVLASDSFTDFEKVMLESRYYRGVGFVPFMRGDREGVIADMDKAEELARALRPSSEWEKYLKVENLHACLESRSKEAFGLGDVALGHRRTLEFLGLDPYDPKSHIELAESLVKQERYAEAGDSYLRAARLGPVSTAIASAMAGECFARAGENVLAEDCFIQALRVDPYAISAARGWRRVAPAEELAARFAGQLEEWGAARQASRSAPRSGQ